MNMEWRIEKEQDSPPNIQYTMSKFSVASLLSVAQITVLISVNLCHRCACLSKCNLKKQSQFIPWGTNPILFSPQHYWGLLR
jgi:hypothetical protein